MINSAFTKRLIKNVIDKWDPMEMNALSRDEYLSVVDDIADHLSSEYSERTTANIIRRAMKAEYGALFTRDREECSAIAAQVLLAIRK